MLDVFKALADKAVSQIEQYGNDILKMLGHFGLEADGDLRILLLKEIDRLIDAELTPQKDEELLSINQLNDLIDTLVYESVLNGVQNHLYLGLADKVHHRREVSLIAFKYQERWLKALSVAKDYLHLSPAVKALRFDSLRDSYPKQYDLASAAKALNEQGANIRIEGLDLVIDGLELIVQHMEAGIREMGNLKMIQIVFAHLANSSFYFKAFNRFSVYNQTLFQQEARQSFIPYGYLLNLCVKQPFRDGKTLSQQSSEEIIHRLSQQAINIGLMASAIGYSIWERALLDIKSLPRKVAQFSLFDAVYGFPSYDIEDILDLIQYISTKLDWQGFEQKHHFRVVELVELFKAILRESPATGPGIIYQSKLRKRLRNVSNENIASMLDTISHREGTINTGYQYYHQSELINFVEKPFVRLGATKFLICDISWCASAFYEVFTNMARDVITDFDGKMGCLIEQYVRAKLSERNISFCYGNYYRDNKKEGDADTVVETDRAIIMMELKKKSLTRKARSGSDIHVLIDLADSLIHAQTQAMKLALTLERDGKVVLGDGMQKYELLKNGRSVECVALSLWDYGSLQDRITTSRILHSLLSAEFGLLQEQQPQIVDKFKELNRKVTKLTDQHNELQTLNSEVGQNMFFNHWFISIPQLLLLLRHCTCNEDFYTTLQRIKFVSTGTNNFYAELRNLVPNIPASS